MAETYTTAALAVAIIGEDEVDANRKAATRTLRKFLRDDMNEGKAVVGKGGRYALEMNKREVTAMAKRFKAWEAKQEADKAARAELKAAQAPKKVSVNAIADDAVKGGDSVNSIDADEIEDDTEIAEGPTDEEIAAMLEDDDLDAI